MSKQLVSRMTASERQELSKIVRLRAKVAKDDAEARGLVLLADVEAKLAAKFKFNDEAWAHITAAAEKAVAEADAQVAEVCRQRGIPEEFRPEINICWYERGENALKERRGELRQVAEAHVEARVKEVKVEIDREAERQLTQLAAGGLTSAEAEGFIGNMPLPEQLLPPVQALTLVNGELVALPDQQNVTPVADQRNTVMDERNSRNACRTCAKALDAGRGLYCSNACRQAAYRQRHRSKTDARPWPSNLLANDS